MSSWCLTGILHVIPRHEGLDLATALRQVGYRGVICLVGSKTFQRFKGTVDVFVWKKYPRKKMNKGRFNFTWLKYSDLKFGWFKHQEEMFVTMITMALSYI